MKQVKNKTLKHDWMFLHCISAAFKKRLQLDVKNKTRYSRGGLRNGGYCSNCVPFFFISNLSYVQVFFHESPSSCLSQGEQGGKCHRKIARRGGETKTQGEEQASGTGKRLSTALRTEGEKVMHPIVFYIYLEREVADEKCLRRRQTFFWLS